MRYCSRSRLVIVSGEGMYKKLSNFYLPSLFDVVIE